MLTVIELYRGKEPRLTDRVDFAQTLRQAAVHHLGSVALTGQIQMQSHPPATSDVYPGPPEIRSLSTRYGRCTLRVLHDGAIVAEKEMALSALFGPVLVDLLRRIDPAETHWAFRIVRVMVLVGAPRHEAPVRPAPEIEGSVELRLEERRHRPFTLTQVAESAAAVVPVERLGLDPAKLDRINVLLSREIHDLFHHGMHLSERMEEGGFLLGRVSRADTGEGGDTAHLVEITHVTPAHRSGAGLTHFTFTGESFLAVARLIGERGRQEELLGWYHTHLLGVNVEIGLSDIDVDLHLATFQKPWQVAALINLDRGTRLLRFYGRGGDRMKEYPQWIADGSGEYRLARPALGGE